MQLGFISLTGTNMILRARALREAGWFPMNSVTEDWALGMRFKKLGYRCRYVNVRCSCPHVLVAAVTPLAGDAGVPAYGQS